MKRLLLVLVVTFLFAISARAATFTESQVGGDTTGAITVVVQKYYNGTEWERHIAVSYETRDSSGVVIRTGNVSIDYGTLTAGQKAYVDGIISKAVTAAKSAASIQ